jgi:hypothetical protein
VDSLTANFNVDIGWISGSGAEAGVGEGDVSEVFFGFGYFLGHDHALFALLGFLFLSLGKPFLAINARAFSTFFIKKGSLL